MKKAQDKATIRGTLSCGTWLWFADAIPKTKTKLTTEWREANMYCSCRIMTANMRIRALWKHYLPIKFASDDSIQEMGSIAQICGRLFSRCVMGVTNGHRWGNELSLFKA